MDKKQLLIIGACVIGGIVLFRLFASSGTSDTSQAISSIGGANAQISAATAADNAGAYSYLSNVAAANYGSQVNILNTQTGGISQGFQALTNIAVGNAAMSAQVASVDAAAAAGMFAARMQADTIITDSNNALTAFLDSQETQRQWQNIQLPLQSMWANTYIQEVLSNNSTQQNIASINAEKDVAINNSWASALVQQAQIAAKAALGQQGALGWGNLILGSQAHASYGWGLVEADKGSSSNSGGK